MLMDGVIRFSEQGRKAIEENNIEQKQFNLVRSQDIIVELVNGLDHEQGGDIATNLSRLYSYALRRLVDANMKNDTTGIDEVQNIFRNLREAWSVAMEKVAKEKAEGQPSPVEKKVSATQPTQNIAPTPAPEAQKKPPEDRPRLSIQG